MTSHLDPARTVADAAVHHHYGKILAALIARFKDFQLAEDCLQDALAQAIASWQAGCIPPNPVAWLTLTAQRKAIDQLRRRASFDAKRSQLAVDLALAEEEDHDASAELTDHRLRLIFTCCHPALNVSAQVALTLKTLCGLSTQQISRAFLVQEPTMAQRLVRTKRKIQVAGIPYEVPDREHWPQRLKAVQKVVYLIFNEGYRSNSTADLIHEDLCQEAVFLGEMLVALIPDDTETLGLLALMYFHQARFNARLSESGSWVSLKQQDRERWNHQQILKADRLLELAFKRASVGPYQVQAAISALHARAPSFAKTDWKQIHLLYEKLYQYEPSPVVELNAAVALSFACDANAGLAALASLESNPAMQHYQPWHAAKADLLARAGDHAKARSHFEKAISLTACEAERAYLEKQIKSLERF